MGFVIKVKSEKFWENKWHSPFLIEFQIKSDEVAIFFLKFNLFLFIIVLMTQKVFNING